MPTIEGLVEITEQIYSLTNKIYLYDWQVEVTPKLFMLQNDGDTVNVLLYAGAIEDADQILKVAYLAGYSGMAVDGWIFAAEFWSYEASVIDGKLADSTLNRTEDLIVAGQAGYDTSVIFAEIDRAGKQLIRRNVEIAKTHLNLLIKIGIAYEAGKAVYLAKFN